jgi:hypothetical protein
VVVLQAVIQMVDDYFLADKGLPTDGPLMKVSSNDKKIIDTCYVGVSPCPDNNTQLHTSDSALQIDSSCSSFLYEMINEKY